MRLFETIGLILGRVEVVLAGAEGHLRDAAEALAKGEPMRARTEAHAILMRVPGSPLALALLADACEMAGLDAELTLTLEELAPKVASRAEVWVRLGRARRKQSAEEEARDAYLRALSVAESGSEARREALIGLADLDLVQNDGARAELWLERLAGATDPAVMIRRAEAKWQVGDVPAARALIRTFESDPTDGRAQLLRGRVLAHTGEEDAFTHLTRAYLLEEPGAREALAGALSKLSASTELRERVRGIVRERGEESLSGWVAAFARAEGRFEDARNALRAAAKAGEPNAAAALFEQALDDRDYESLHEALSLLGEAPPSALQEDARALPSPSEIVSAEQLAPLLTRIRSIRSERLSPWVEQIRHDLIRASVPTNGGARWGELLTCLDDHATALHDLEATRQISELSGERTRPIRIAIVGEFNAGKSTFINALMGADVAPTGVLPTTATLHHLRYAPDPIAKIIFDDHAEPKERIVPVSDLRSALKSSDSSLVARVEIRMPLPSLTRAEVLDTPGFNAPDPRHTEAARAAFVEADFALWLLDATQPLKSTEQRVLDEAKEAQLPVQVLVNKVDRLSAEERPRVMAHLEEAIGRGDISSFRKPLAFSARLALQGKMGDATALDASNWGEVDGLLETEIIGRSDALKERALRRRARAIAGRLGQRAAREQERLNEQRERERAIAQACATAAAEIDSDADANSEILRGALSRAVDAWRKDVEAIVAGRDRQSATSDPALARYRANRAVAHLAPELARTLATMANSHGVHSAEFTEASLATLARAIVRTFAFSEGAHLSSLTRSAIASLIERLTHAAVSGRERSLGSHSRVAELRAIVDALA